MRALFHRVIDVSVCFKIFDGDRDGVLKRSELELMAKCLVEVMSQVKGLNC